MNSIQPNYVKTSPGILEQIQKGILFFSRRNKRHLFLAYFQSYTSTFGSEEGLIRQIEEAVAHPLISGIVISTRPDCVSDALCNYLSSLSNKCYVAVEFGIESTDEETLKRTALSRGSARKTSDCAQVGWYKECALRHIGGFRIAKTRLLPGTVIQRQLRTNQFEV